MEKELITPYNGSRVDKVISPGTAICGRFNIRAGSTHIILNYIPFGCELNHIKVGHKIHLLIDDITFLDDCKDELYSLIKKGYEITKRKVTIHIPASEHIVFKEVQDMLYIFDNDLCDKCKLFKVTREMRIKYKVEIYKVEGIRICLYTPEKPIIGFKRFMCTPYIEEDRIRRYYESRNRELC